MAEQNGEIIDPLKNLSEKDFQSFGLHHIAYVKPVTVRNNKAYGLYAADGTQLTILDDFNTALVLARQNDLEPVTLH